MFVLFLRGRCPDFKACAIQVLRLRTANLLQGATLTVSLYGRLFIESFRLYYLRNIFTAFAVGLSGQNEAKFQKLESFLSLPSIIGYLGKETKNTAEHVIMKKKNFLSQMSQSFSSIVIVSDESLVELEELCAEQCVPLWKKILQ